MSLSRREILGLGAAALAGVPPLAPSARQEPPEPYLTPQEKFRDVSRGTPLPHKLSPEKRVEAGLTPETWKMEVVSDPANKAQIGKPLTLDWDGLQRLAEKRAVRFLKVMTCNNIGRPLGMGLWEGVPLRDLIWLTDPQEDLRRVFYYGFHNNDPKQMFRSSLPIGRVLEDPPGLPPVIVCFKLNGQFLTPERGGPVRIVVPEAYGFKSVKWLSHVVLTNLAFANDTYMDGNNDIDSPLKTFARVLQIQKELKPDQPTVVQGVAQVGISGLSKVQVWVSRADEKGPEDDPMFTKAPWKEAEILPPPTSWGGGVPDGNLPGPTIGFDPGTGKPLRWPIPFTKAHWRATLPGLAEGKYTFRSRTIDSNGVAQPMPRPFKKSGHASIEEVAIVVKPV
jgi:DMSO/TMAO reductase YedYZ molybdopterin-dependent catalytic subunit